MKKHWEIYCLVPKIENYKRHYYDDIYSDDGVESDNEFSENDDKEIGQKKKESRKGTVARMATTMVTETA